MKGIAGVFQKERIPHDDKLPIKVWHVGLSRLKKLFYYGVSSFTTKVPII